MIFTEELTLSTQVLAETRNQSVHEASRELGEEAFPNQDIYIVGSAYHGYRGNSEGALVSANNALLEGWGIPVPSPPKEARMVKPGKAHRTNLKMIR